MLHKLFLQLARRCNPSAQIDPKLPSCFLVRILIQRAVWLLQGLVRTGQKVFIGCGVTLIGKNNIQFGKHVTIESHAYINAIADQKVIFGNNSKIGAYSRIFCTAHMSKIGRYFRIGNHSACGEFCYFGAAGGIEIGDNVIMGQYVSFHAQNHTFDTPHKLIREQGTTEHGIKIGNDCWIGAKATILDGTIIGNHCVIAAGAVVKGTFPDNCVIGGVPAIIIRSIHDA